MLARHGAAADGVYADFVATRAHAAAPIDAFALVFRVDGGKQQLGGAAGRVLLIAVVRLYHLDIEQVAHAAHFGQQALKNRNARGEIRRMHDGRFLRGLGNILAVRVAQARGAQHQRCTVSRRALAYGAGVVGVGKIDDHVRRADGIRLRHVFGGAGQRQILAGGDFRLHRAAHAAAAHNPDL